MVSVRLVTADSYQAQPLPQLDPTFSVFRGSEIKHVPVIRVFGSTANGEKTCLHVHGVFPYLFVPYTGEEDPNILAYRLAASLDSAINVSLGSATSNAQHVYSIQRVSGTPFYGYHRKKHQFFKIYFYNPAMIKRAADLLQNGSVLNQSLQPHEAHINYILQFMMDYNIYGMSFVNLRSVKHRRESQTLAELTSAEQRISSGNSEIDYLPMEIERQSTCKLEIDALASDILNRLDIEKDIKLNPGLAAIWDEERARRAKAGFQGGDSQLVNPKSPSRPPYNPTENDAYQEQRLARRLLMISQGDESTLSTTSNRSVAYAAEVRDDENLLNASRLLNVSVKSNERISNVGHDDSLGNISFVDSPTNQTSQSITQNCSILETDDMPLIDILAELARNNEDNSESVDADSLLGSQRTIRFNDDEKSDNEDDEVTDLNLTSLQLDSLDFLDSDVCNVEKRKSLEKIVKADDIHASPFQSSCEISASPKSSDENDTTINEDTTFRRMPQYDGAGDVSPTLLHSDNEDPRDDPNNAKEFDHPPEYKDTSESMDDVVETSLKKSSYGNNNSDMTIVNDSSRNNDYLRNSRDSGDTLLEEMSSDLANGVYLEQYGNYEPFDRFLEMSADFPPDFVDFQSSMEIGGLTSSNDLEKGEFAGNPIDREVSLETVLNGDPCFTESAEFDKSDVTELRDQYVSLLGNSLLPVIHNNPRIDRNLSVSASFVATNYHGSEKTLEITRDPRLTRGKRINRENSSSLENIQSDIREFVNDRKIDDKRIASSFKEQGCQTNDTSDYNCNVVATWAELQNLQIIDKTENHGCFSRGKTCNEKVARTMKKRRRIYRKSSDNLSGRISRENTYYPSSRFTDDRTESSNESVINSSCDNTSSSSHGCETVKNHLETDKPNDTTMIIREKILSRSSLSDISRLSIFSKEHSEKRAFPILQEADSLDVFNRSIVVSDKSLADGKNPPSIDNNATCSSDTNDNLAESMITDFLNSNENRIEDLNEKNIIDEQTSSGTSYYCSKKSESLLKIVDRQHRHCFVSKLKKLVKQRAFTSDELWIIQKRKRGAVQRGKNDSKICTERACKLPIVYLEKIERKRNENIVAEKIEENLSGETADERVKVCENSGFASKERSEKKIALSKRETRMKGRKTHENSETSSSTNNSGVFNDSAEKIVTSISDDEKTISKDSISRKSPVPDVRYTQNVLSINRRVSDSCDTGRHAISRNSIEQRRRNSKLPADKRKTDEKRAKKSRGKTKRKEDSLPGIPGIVDYGKPKKSYCPKRIISTIRSGITCDGVTEVASKPKEHLSSKTMANSKNQRKITKYSSNCVVKKLPVDCLVPTCEKAEILSEKRKYRSIKKTTRLSPVPKKNTDSENHKEDLTRKFAILSSTPEKLEKTGPMEMDKIDASVSPKKLPETVTLSLMLQEAKSRSTRTALKLLLEKRLSENLTSEKIATKSLIKTYKSNNDKTNENKLISASLTSEKSANSGFNCEINDVSSEKNTLSTSTNYLPSLNNSTDIHSDKFDNSKLTEKYCNSAEDGTTVIFHTEKIENFVIEKNTNVEELSNVAKSPACDGNFYDNATEDANFSADKDYTIDAVSNEIPNCLFEEDSNSIEVSKKNHANNIDNGEDPFDAIDDYSSESGTNLRDYLDVYDVESLTPTSCLSLIDDANDATECSIELSEIDDSSIIDTMDRVESIDHSERSNVELVNMVNSEKTVTEDETSNEEDSPSFEALSPQPRVSALIDTSLEEEFTVDTENPSELLINCQTSNDLSNSIQMTIESVRNEENNKEKESSDFNETDLSISGDDSKISRDSMNNLELRLSVEEQDLSVSIQTQKELKIDAKDKELSKNNIFSSEKDSAIGKFVEKPTKLFISDQLEITSLTIDHENEKLPEDNDEKSDWLMNFNDEKEITIITNDETNTLIFFVSEKDLSRYSSVSIQSTIFEENLNSSLNIENQSEKLIIDEKSKEQSSSMENESNIGKIVKNDEKSVDNVDNEMENIFSTSVPTENAFSAIIVNEENFPKIIEKPATLQIVCEKNQKIDTSVESSIIDDENSRESSKRRTKFSSVSELENAKSIIFINNQEPEETGEQVKRSKIKDDEKQVSRKLKDNQIEGKIDNKAVYTTESEIISRNDKILNSAKNDVVHQNFIAESSKNQVECRPISIKLVNIDLSKIHNTLRKFQQTKIQKLSAPELISQDNDKGTEREKIRKNSDITNSVEIADERIIVEKTNGPMNSCPRENVEKTVTNESRCSLENKGRKSRKRIPRDTRMPERRSIRLCAEMTLKLSQEKRFSEIVTGSADSDEEKVVQKRKNSRVISVMESSMKKNSRNIAENQRDFFTSEQETIVPEAKKVLSSEVVLSEEIIANENAEPSAMKIQRRERLKKNTQNHCHEVTLSTRIIDENTAPIDEKTTRTNSQRDRREIFVEKSSKLKPKDTIRRNIEKTSSVIDMQPIEFEFKIAETNSDSRNSMISKKVRSMNGRESKIRSACTKRRNRLPKSSRNKRNEKRIGILHNSESSTEKNSMESENKDRISSMIFSLPVSDTNTAFFTDRRGRSIKKLGTSEESLENNELPTMDIFNDNRDVNNSDNNKRRNRSANNERKTSIALKSQSCFLENPETKLDPAVSELLLQRMVKTCGKSRTSFIPKKGRSSGGSFEDHSHEENLKIVLKERTPEPQMFLQNITDRCIKSETSIGLAKDVSGMNFETETHRTLSPAEHPDSFIESKESSLLLRSIMEKNIETNISTMPKRRGRPRKKLKIMTNESTMEKSATNFRESTHDKFPTDKCTFDHTKSEEKQRCFLKSANAIAKASSRIVSYSDEKTPQSTRRNVEKPELSNEKRDGNIETKMFPRFVNGQSFEEHSDPNFHKNVTSESLLKTQKISTSQRNFCKPEIPCETNVRANSSPKEMLITKKSERLDEKSFGKYEDYCGNNNSSSDEKVFEASRKSRSSPVNRSATPTRMNKEMIFERNSNHSSRLKNLEFSKLESINLCARLKLWRCQKNDNSDSAKHYENRKIIETKFHRAKNNNLIDDKLLIKQLDGKTLQSSRSKSPLHISSNFPHFPLDNFSCKIKKPSIVLERLNRDLLKDYGIVYKPRLKKFVKISKKAKNNDNAIMDDEKLKLPAYDGPADFSSSDTDEDPDLTIAREEKRVCSYSSTKKALSAKSHNVVTPKKRKLDFGDEQTSSSPSDKRRRVPTTSRDETTPKKLLYRSLSRTSMLKSPGRIAANYSPLKIIVTSPKVRKDMFEPRLSFRSEKNDDDDDVNTSSLRPSDSSLTSAETSTSKNSRLRDNVLRGRIKNIESSISELGEKHAIMGRMEANVVGESDEIRTIGQREHGAINTAAMIECHESSRIDDSTTIFRDGKDVRKKLVFSENFIDDNAKLSSFDTSEYHEEPSEDEDSIVTTKYPRNQGTMMPDAVAGPSRSDHNVDSENRRIDETLCESNDDDENDDDDVGNVTFTQFIDSQINKKAETSFSLNLDGTNDKSKKIMIVAPKFEPPSRQSVIDTMENYGLPKFRNEEPFFGNSADVTKQKELAQKMLKVPGKGIEYLPQFVSSNADVTGLSRWRKMWLNEFHPSLVKSKESSVKIALAGDDKIIITPLAKPPAQREVKNWLKARRYLERKKNEVSDESSDKPEVDDTNAGKSDVNLSSNDVISVTNEMEDDAVLRETLKKTVKNFDNCKNEKKGDDMIPERSSGLENNSSSKFDDTGITDPSLLDLLKKSHLFRDGQASKHLGISCGQIEFLSDSTRSNVAEENLQNAKALTRYQYLTIMCLEVHVTTREDLSPDVQFDPIAAIFYSVQSDVPPTSSIKPLEHGVIALTETEKSKNKMYYSNSSDIPWTISFANDEEALLNSLVNLVTRTDPDILIGWQIETLSWGYVFQRASHLGINLVKRVSRIPATQYKWEYQAPDIEKLTEVKLPGRIVLDIWRLMRHEAALLSYTFESVMHHVLNERISCPSFKTLTEWWNVEKSRPSRWRVVEHYGTRVIGVLRILDQLDIIGRTSELARLFGIQFFEVFSRGSQFRVESVMLRLAKPMNYIAVSPSPQQRASMRAMEALPLIMEPESMFYSDPVIVLDFQSLYPSIIIAHNYCFSTCLGRIEHIGKPEPFEFGAYTLRVPKRTALKLQGKVNYAPCGVAYVKSDVRTGILPRMLTEILETRFMVKKAMKDHKRDDKTLQRALHSRQMGLKFLANVTYGYTAANFSGRMPCIEVGDSVISKSKETLERAIKLVESTPKWGARVIYGDTDSLFILVPGKSKADAFVIGNEIADAVTASNLPPIKLKFEKILYPTILQTKKRYCGYMYETPEQEIPTYLAKGIETVRRDGCPAVSKILEKSLKILFETKDLSLLKKYVTRQLDKVLRGKVSIQDLTFAKEFRGLNGYKAKACVPALELTRRLMRKDPRAVPRTSERVRYVIVAGAPNQALIHCVRTPWELINDPGLRPNAIYYVTRVIIPPLNRCLNLMGVDVNDWYREMPHRQILVNPVGQPSDKQKLTIFQYFGTIVCVACGQPSNKGICMQCLECPSDTLVVIHEKIRWLDRADNLVTAVCQSCVGQADVANCASLDCPVLYRRAQARRELTQANQLREVIEFGNNLEF